MPPRRSWARTWVPGSRTFYIVDDGAADRPAGLYQVGLEGQVLRRLAFGKDLEGVCYSPSERRLYAADEADERVWVVAEPTMELLGSFTVSRLWQGKEVLQQGGNGFEGIEWIGQTPGGDGNYLLLASDRRVDSVLLESLIQEQKDLDLIPKVVTGLLAHRKRGRWLNTQENTFALLAMDKYFQTYEKTTPDFAVLSVERPVSCLMPSSVVTLFVHS